MLLIAHPPGNTATVVYFRGNENRTTQATIAAQPKSLETGGKTLRDGNVSSSVVTVPEGRLIGARYLGDADSLHEDRGTASNCKLWSASPSE